MKITFSQYKRLLLVSFIPLLIIGAMFSYHDSLHRDVLSILCQPHLYSEDENCRYMGKYSTHDTFYSNVKKGYASWFNIYPTDNSRFLSIIIQGSERSLLADRILEVNPYAGYSAEIARYIDRLIGKEAVIMLGIIDSIPQSVITENSVYLLCDSTSYEASNDSYTSSCKGDKWGEWIVIKYKVSGRSRDMLSSLNASISEEIKELDRANIRNWIITTLFFLFVFLILSLIIWLFAKAYNYVKSD